MRLAAAIVGGVLLLAGLPERATALQCGWAMPWHFLPETLLSHPYLSAEAEARAAIENLSRATTIVRGRIKAVRSLVTDERQTNTPVREIILTDVVVLRGRPQRAGTKDVVVIEVAWCDADCGQPAGKNWPIGKAVTIAPEVAGKPEPIKLPTFDEPMPYRGRAHYRLGACDRPLGPLDLRVLDMPPHEMARLKRNYPPLEP